MKPEDEAPDDQAPDNQVSDEEFISSLLNSANHDMPAPDPDFLARLRERSTAAFLEATAHSGSRQASDASAGNSDLRTPRPHRRRFMTTAAFKLVAAGVAAALVLLAGLWSFGPRHSELAFGDALDRTAAARSLHLQVTRDGVADDIWYAGPGKWRWNKADGTYEIAREDGLWRIDERENLAARDSSEPSHFSDKAGLDLLKLLAAGESEALGSARSQSPAETIERDGMRLLHYQLQVAGKSERLVLDAFVDVTTELVDTLELHAARNGRLEPVAALNVLAVNAPVADEQFVVRDTLTEDGRIGNIAEVQGLALLKPVMHERWTAVCGKTLLKPGDWIRTDNRGANAATIRLVKQTQVTLGPGSLVEFVSPSLIRVHSGELEAAVGEKDSLEIAGPGDAKTAVSGTQVYRASAEKLVRLEHEPLWLKGYRGTTSAEKMGSLIALVDGRAVPLSVGYHKVTVDIRDQIARTVIEESFVNHTSTQMEGIFYFPLPDDASISGFGLWIGNELVEADVVEKQRAREIYETILRERRDPGLLEWTGGNIFKARVFPIPANAEKRIKLSYTQVLPARGNSYRYSYALQSDLLKLHPLRELSIDVKVNSAVPLNAISSPTHTVRSDKTSHSAHVEFAAQDYTPTRDFEVVVETERRQAELVLIPHRRGDDGYFMLQLTPPAGGEWQREIVPDGEPVELLILADTSASMDRALRHRQAEFIAGLLSALTPRDSVNLAGCDADCDWVFEKPAPVEPKNVAAIRGFLETRHSLGWTDLDGAFASAFKQSGPKTQIIYLGDGIVTTGDARPDGFVQRVRQLYGEGQGTCHAVALGSSFEAAVLKAIASLGSGSLRRISADERPEAAATALLREITQPGLRDLKVEFRGLQVARVYPEELPNLPVGMQQILLGLYQPRGGDQTGEVVVTGTQDGKPVKFSARVALKDAEWGNSFIPRLWAKLHLESLLAQGAAPSIRDEVIALSEEFQIMTPYTSFLVLETDADRERFKVKRRFRMRDGEKYFQEGRDTANFELVQQQMKRAGNWRLALRRQALAQLATLGRDARVFQALSSQGVSRNVDLADESAPMGSPGIAGGDFFSEFDSGGTVTLLGAMGPRGTAGGLSSSFAAEDRKESFGFNGPVDALGDEAGEPASRELAAAAPSDDGEADVNGRFGGDDLGKQSNYDGRRKREAADKAPEFFDAEWSEVTFGNRAGLMAGGFGAGGMRGMAMGRAGKPYGYFGRAYWNRPDYTSWINTLFPALPPLAPAKKPRAGKTTWPAEAVEFSESLLRTAALSDLAGGLEIFREAQSFEPRWNELTSRSKRHDLYSPARWLTRSENAGQTLVHWANENERSVMGLAFGLGRTRKSAASDLGPAVLDQSDSTYLGLNDHSLTPLHEAYRGYTPTIERQDANRVVLVLKQTGNTKYETRVTIDAARRVMLSIEHRFDGKLTGTTKFDDFVEVAGSWWARRIEMLDESGRRTWLITQTVEAVPANEFPGRIAAELTLRNKVQFLHFPLPSVLEAKRAQARLGRLTFESQFVLLVHFAQSQQWTKVFDELEHCERLAAGKAGMRWVRNSVLAISRRHEELRARFTAAAALLAEGNLAIEPRAADAARPPTGDELFLAEHLFGQGSGFISGDEMLVFWQALRPVYERQPAERRALKTWRERRVNLLQNIGRPDEVRRERHQLAIDYPHDYSLQQAYAQLLFNEGDHGSAYDWLQKALEAPDARWNGYEADSLRGTCAQFLYQQGRFDDLSDFLAQWLERSPENSSVAQQYLGALVQADRVPKFEELMTQWLKDGMAETELSPAVAARLSAAVSVALGQGHYFYVDWIDQKWQEPLADVVLAIARTTRDMNPAQQIMGHWRFQPTDACRRVRSEVLKLLLAGIPKLAPDRMRSMIDWIMPNDPAVPIESWRQIAKDLEARWTAETDADKRYAVGQTLVHVLGSRIGTQELLTFLRRQLAEGPEKFRAASANQLFNTILSQPWEAALEDEAFALLERLSDAEEPIDRLQVQAAALYRLTDAMVNARNQAGLARIEHIEQLSNAERRRRTAEQLRLAREGFADRLQEELPRHQGELVKWLEVEREYLDVLAGRQLADVARKSFDALTALPVPPAPAADAPPDPEAHVSRVLALVLRGRYLTTVAHLATRKEADAGLADRLLKFIDERLEAEPDVASWKGLKYEVLVALDRPEELKQALTGWINADGADSRWRLALAYLQAERGAVPEAIALVEGVEIADDLGPAMYRVLADWYLAANRREAHERAMIRAFQTLEEWRMSQALYRWLSPWQQTGGHLPSELDPNVLLMFRALFEKSQSPQNYLGQLQQFYMASRDFRLLAVMADSVVGHTAQTVYPFIQGMRGVLNEIRDEATADQLREQIAAIRERANTHVDRRALDLLELQVERRAAEVKNQPGPHAAAALAALKRAAEHEWGPGEQRLMADFLAGLGGISDKALSSEQLRQLRAMYDAQPRESYDRLHVGQRLAEALWASGPLAEAIDLLQGALDEFAQAHGGVLPVSANAALGTLVSYLDNQRHFVRAEKLLAEQLTHPVHGQQRLWLKQQLYGVLLDALRHDGEVSLGSGRTLYRALETAILKELNTPDQNHRYNLVNQVCSVYRAAHEKKIAGVAGDLIAFANRTLPDVLKRQTSNYTALVNQVAVTLHDVAGVRAGLAFLIERVEQQPGWFRYSNQDSWVNFAGTLNSWRIELGNLGDLDGRLLKIVLAELRRDLSTQQQRNRDSYWSIHDQRFWREKLDDFARVADEVYSERKSSGAAVKYIADYLFHGLRRTKRAIEILFVAQRDRILDEGGVSNLVVFLQQEDRFGESISLLDNLIEEHPDNLNYRVWQMQAFFRTGRKAELLALLKQTDDYFHRDNRWGEHVLAALAGSCLGNELFEQSARYYSELIPRHEQSQPNRGIGNGTLSTYYAGLARACAGLKKTGEAVDAACGAIISWGSQQANRMQAIAALKDVLRQSPDLAAYTVELDRKAEADRQDRPLVRKALGQVLLEKHDVPLAIAQLQKAVALEPADVEAHQSLIACYDQEADREGAIRELLALVDVSRRDAALYKSLADRYAALERPREAERAHTSIVEMLPAESESHAQLAEVREQQDRWPEAIEQWRQVARIRELEPTGLLRLADAQLHEKQWDAARDTLRKLDTTTWPARFGNVHEQVRERERRLEAGLRK